VVSENRAKYVGESVKKPLLYYKNNVAGSIALLETLNEFGPLPFIFSPSWVTYGIPESIPLSEEHPQNPINPDGHSKLFVERMLADAGAAYGLPWVALRYSNAAGADPDGDIGEDHNPETHLIPLVVRAARDKTPVEIYYPTWSTLQRGRRKNAATRRSQENGPRSGVTASEAKVMRRNQYRAPHRARRKRKTLSGNFDSKTFNSYAKRPRLQPLSAFRHAPVVGVVLPVGLGRVSSISAVFSKEFNQRVDDVFIAVGVGQIWRNGPVRG
jgi:NAD dependent epimerase/dehydratase family